MHVNILSHANSKNIITKYNGAKMAILNNWCVLCSGGKYFFAARDVSEHPLIPHGPIITSVIVDGKVGEGEIVKTQSGTIYKLGTPLPADDDCEFAKPLLVERVGRYFAKNDSALSLQQLEQLLALIDKVLSSRKYNIM